MSSDLLRHAMPCACEHTNTCTHNNNTIIIVKIKILKLISFLSYRINFRSVFLKSQGEKMFPSALILQRSTGEAVPTGSLSPRDQGSAFVNIQNTRHLCEWSGRGSGEGESERSGDPFMNKIILPIWNNIVLSVISRGTVNVILEPPNFPSCFLEPLLGTLHSVFILPLKIQRHAFSVSATVGHVQVAHWTISITSCSAAMGNLNQPQMKSTTFSSFRDDNYVSTITKIKK